MAVPQDDIPDFDILDMLVGFGIAATVAAQQYPAAMLLAGGFVVQKAVRNNPDVRERIDDLRKQLPGPTALLARARGAGERAARPQLADATHDASAPEAGDESLLLELEEAPHLLVIGHTRGGKTTLIHELAQRRVRKRERVVVCDPDAAPGTWPGCTVYGGGDRFDEIAQALAITDGVVRTRRQARREGRRSFPPMHLIMDEVQDIFAEVENARELAETIARRGAKLNMHLVLGVQDKQVRTLGWEGKGEIRNNFLVADVYRDRTTGQRFARLESAGEKTTRPIPALPDPAALIVARRAEGANSVRVSGGSGDALLAALLARPIDGDASRTLPHGDAFRPLPDPFPTPSGASERERADTRAVPAHTAAADALPAPGVHVVFADTGAVPVATSLTLVLPREGEIDKDGKIKALVALGVSATKIREIVGGRNTEIGAKVRQAKAELGLALAAEDED